MTFLYDARRTLAPLYKNCRLALVALSKASANTLHLHDHTCILYLFSITLHYQPFSHLCQCHYAVVTYIHDLHPRVP